MVWTALCDREKAALCRSLMAFHTIRLFDSFGNTEAVMEIHTSAFRNQKHVCLTVQCKIKEMPYFALFIYIFDIHLDNCFALCIHFFVHCITFHHKLWFYSPNSVISVKQIIHSTQIIHHGRICSTLFSLLYYVNWNDITIQRLRSWNMQKRILFYAWMRIKIISQKNKKNKVKVFRS